MPPKPSRVSSAVTSAFALGVLLNLTHDQIPEPRLGDTIRRAWRDCTCPPQHPSRQLEVLIPATAVPPLEQALSDLSTQVTLAALDALRGTRLLLHAAGIAAPDGRVLALVGPSGRGKTTASRHLGRHYGYVSDETVAVDPDLTVYPYRKPLSIIVEGKPFKEQIAPSDLGLLPLPDAPLRLTGITLIDRDPDTDTPGAFPVDLIDAICEMTPQISYLPDLPSPLQYVARIVDQIGGVTRLIYRDAVDLPALVDAMFAAPAPEAQPWTVAPPAVGTGPWRCAEVDDAILVDGRACILREGTVTALDHRGALAWTMCLEGASTEQITHAAVAAFGEPHGSNPRDLMTQTLEELVAHGLLTKT